MAKLALVCSSGGHLFQLLSQCHFWKSKDRFWVSFPTIDAKYLLKDETVFWAHYPTNRSIKNLLRNLILSIKLLKKERPDVIISTGAGVAVPFILVGKLSGIKTIYIESITRSKDLSLTGYLVYTFVDKFLVQWPELAENHKRAEYQGQVI